MSATLIQEGGIPSEVNQLRLALVGENDSTETPLQHDPAISSIPLRDSRGLPHEPSPRDNPTIWPTARGTPDYRPYEAHIDYAERPLGQNGGEFGFLIFMLSGVQIVGAANYVWRSTVGKVTDEVFKYKIGGQW